MAYRRFYNITVPEIGDLEKEYLYDTFDSGWIRSRGTYIERFESEFVHYNWVKFLVSYSNNAVGHYLTLNSPDQKEGDEVLVPNLTFAFLANAVIYRLAKSIFVDSDRFYRPINPEEVEKNVTKKSRVIIVLHIYGHPANIVKIMKIAQQYNCMVIEDCEEVYCATFSVEKLGSIGDIGCFSFYGNKAIITCKGTMDTTNKRDHKATIRTLRDVE